MAVTTPAADQGKTPTLRLFLSHDLDAALRAAADAAGSSASGYVTALLAEHLGVEAPAVRAARGKAKRTTGARPPAAPKPAPPPAPPPPEPEPEPEPTPPPAAEPTPAKGATPSGERCLLVKATPNAPFRSCAYCGGGEMLMRVRAGNPCPRRE